ncbi:MAG: glycosyltransferase family 4 protein [Bacteroidales bacterium]|jgi:glycosyltransferase involved in cell wall biosynthesis|nr:glycosyltransferase family 4 protein [Bacteroidales bacterium]
MNILIISNKAVYPRDGGNLAILNLAQGYAKKEHHVVILNIVTHKHCNRTEDISSLKNQHIDLTGVSVDTRISIYKLIKNLLFSTHPYNLERFISTDFSEKILELIKQQSFDFIQLESLYTLPYIDLIRKNYAGKIVYRPHNIEYTIWKENASYSRYLIKKMYFNLLSKRLKKFEQSHINTYDLLLPISHTDGLFYEQFKNTKPFLVTPFGINAEFYRNINTQQNTKEEHPTLLFLGSLDWIPNQMGLYWFIKNVLPKIRNKIPEIRLKVAGRNAPAWFIKKLAKHKVQYYGTIENASDFLLSDGLVIVPLFAGSGMRVKIIEAMALGKTIISTPKGAEGIKATSNEIIIAENANQLTESIVNLINNKEKQIEIGNFAKQRIKTDYNSDTIAENTLQFIAQH